MSKEIRVAVVGVGNCVNAFIQGLEFYKGIEKDSLPVPGLKRNSIGGYLVRDIEIVAAFDVNAQKIGKDIAEAIWAPPNNAAWFCDVPKTGVVVSPGYLLDGVAPHMTEKVAPLVGDPALVEEVLVATKPAMLVSYLPVGSAEASLFYARLCIKLGIAFINAMPTFIASDSALAEEFRIAGVACAGDDVASQLGATILNQVLLWLFAERGLVAEESEQLNYGGNADFENMLDETRVESKRISKKTRLLYEAPDCEIIAMPAGYVSELRDRKKAVITITGKQFGNLPVDLKVELNVEDSANSAGIIIDAARCMQVSLDAGLVGYQDWSAWCFKHPLKLLSLVEARLMMQKYAK